MTTTGCGLWGCRPKWLQRFTTQRTYLVIYVTIGLIQGMSLTYLSSVLSTVEKQFGINSQEVAWIFSGNEISQVFFIFLLPFLNRIKKRTLWTGLGVLAGGFGLLLCSSPYLVSDKSKYEGGWTQSGVGRSGLCGEKIEQEDCENGNAVKNWSGLLAIFFGFVISGIGISVYTSFGVPYIDDNVSRNNSPAFLGFVGAARTMGPALGFILGTICLKMYVVPGGQQDLREGDPGWLGAWWLGWFVIAIIVILLAPLLALFPQRLSNENTDAVRLERLEIDQGEQSIKGSLNETKECIKRLGRTKVFVYNTISTTIILFGIIGFGTFAPKYFEFHFRQSASSSGSSGGLVLAIGSSLGMIISGFGISKYKFRARTLAGWNIILGAISAAAFLSISFISCPRLEMTPRDACGSSCLCSDTEYQPVCSTDGVTTFFSPCFAGCRHVTKLIDNVPHPVNVYENCSCSSQISSERNTSNIDPWWIEDIPSLPSPIITASPIPEDVSVSGAVQGYCPINCTRQFVMMLVVLLINSFLSSTGRVANQLISLRAVELRDKAASLVITVSFISLFAFLPSPIIFGATMDNACLEWGVRCGEKTNCLVYDTDKMRQYMMWFVASCLALGTVVDVGVWYHVADLQLYEDVEEEVEMEASKK